MKIFLGIVNIASQFIDLKEGFENLGIETVSVNYFDGSKIINNQVDYDFAKIRSFIPLFKPRRISTRLQKWLDSISKYFIFGKLKKECDVFIFFWNSFDENFSDLKELKNLGKKVICVYVGDDVRWYFPMKQEFESYGYRPIRYPTLYDYSLKGLNTRLERLRKGEKYADFIFSRKDQAQMQLRPYYKWNMMVNSKKFIENCTQRKNRPKVAHAPTSREVKGTMYVLEVFERLKKEGIEFEPVLIENVSHSQALKIYSDVDIVIDQLLCPGTGKLATESLAFGTIVMGFMGYGNYAPINSLDCPIIDVNPENLYIELKNLILNYEYREVLAKKGRPYVEKYLDVSHFCKKVIDLLQQKEIEYDYYPEFFRDHFIPESHESVKMYNEWTKYVSECEWYKEKVKMGERDALIF